MPHKLTVLDRALKYHTNCLDYMELLNIVIFLGKTGLLSCFLSVILSSCVSLVDVFVFVFNGLFVDVK